MKNPLSSISLTFQTDEKYDNMLKKLQNQRVPDYELKQGKNFYTPLNLEVVKKSQVQFTSHFGISGIY